MLVTSNELLQNILNSINTALINEALTEDNRSALIDQYERTTKMIISGFEYIEIGIGDLPTMVRDETLLLANEVIATLENSAQLINTNLTTQADAKIADLNNSLSAFETSATDLKALLTLDAQAINTNLTTQADAKIADLNNSLSAFEASAIDLKALLASDAQAINTNLTTQADAKIADLNNSLLAFETSAADLKALFTSDAEIINTSLNNSLLAFETSATDLKALLTSDALAINTKLTTQVDAKIIYLNSLPDVIRAETQTLVDAEIESLDDWKRNPTIDNESFGKYVGDVPCDGNWHVIIGNLDDHHLFDVKLSVKFPNFHALGFFKVAVTYGLGSIESFTSGSLYNTDCELRIVGSLYDYNIEARTTGINDSCSLSYSVKEL